MVLELGLVKEMWEIAFRNVCYPENSCNAEKGLGRYCRGPQAEYCKSKLLQQSSVLSSRDLSDGPWRMTLEESHHNEVLCLGRQMKLIVSLSFVQVQVWIHLYLHTESHPSSQPACRCC